MDIFRLRLTFLRPQFLPNNIPHISNHKPAKNLSEERKCVRKENINMTFTMQLVRDVHDGCMITPQIKHPQNIRVKCPSTSSKKHVNTFNIQTTFNSRCRLQL